MDLLVSISFLAITVIVNQLGVIASAGVGVAEKLCGFILLVPSSYTQSMSAYVAQNIGACQPQRAKRGMHYGMLTSFLLGLIMCYFAFFHGDALSRIFTKNSAVILAGKPGGRGVPLPHYTCAPLFYSSPDHFLLVVLQMRISQAAEKTMPAELAQLP